LTDTIRLQPTSITCTLTHHLFFLFFFPSLLFPLHHPHLDQPLYLSASHLHRRCNESPPRPTKFDLDSRHLILHHLTRHLGRLPTKPPRHHINNHPSCLRRRFAAPSRSARTLPSVLSVTAGSATATSVASTASSRTTSAPAWKTARSNPMSAMPPSSSLSARKSSVESSRILLPRVYIPSQA
ncbi:hypothetical protein CI238_00153, partial [Colletotrichum incanum]